MNATRKAFVTGICRNVALEYPPGPDRPVWPVSFDTGAAGFVHSEAMNPQQIQQMLERVGAVRHGHFVLSSGRHSATYVQCALVLAHPELAEALGRALVEQFAGIEADVVVSLALGGLILGHEVARALGVRALFVEREADGHMALRRQFELQPEERVLVIEDVWTTGKSTREAVEVVEKLGGRVAALGCLVDRSGGKLEWDVPARSLLEITIPNYESDDCPLCRSGDMAVRPGSRFEQAPKPGSERAHAAHPGETRPPRHR